MRSFGAFAAGVVVVVLVVGSWGPPTPADDAVLPPAVYAAPDAGQLVLGPLPTVSALSAQAMVEVEPAGHAVRGTVAQVTPTLPPPTTTVARWHHWYADVDRWHDTAVEAGWPAADWRRLSCIIYRESRGIPTAFNGAGRDESYGLAQVNMKAHRSWVGPLVGWDFTLLFDPKVNLWIARDLFHRAEKAYGSGWQPWKATDGSCS